MVEDGSHLQDVSCACGRYATGIPETKITSGRADQLLMYYWGYWYKYHYLDNDVIAFASCVLSPSTHGRRTETPPSPQHGDVRSTTPRRSASATATSHCQARPSPLERSLTTTTELLLNAEKSCRGIPRPSCTEKQSLRLSICPALRSGHLRRLRPTSYLRLNTQR